MVGLNVDRNRTKIAGPLVASVLDPQIPGCCCYYPTNTDHPSTVLLFTVIFGSKWCYCFVVLKLLFLLVA